MADFVDQWSANGLKNIFGTTVKVVEMQSEAGAAGTVHGSLGAGALTTTYTASQGLLLMIPNMYKIAGELLPAVFHVSARTVSTQALNIFGDHSDVMACRQTGFAMLCEGNVQEVMDLSPVAHLAAIEGQRSLHQLLRRLPHLPRDPEDRRVGLRGSEGNVRHGRRGGVPQPRPEPRASPYARQPRERRYLLPAPRGLQQVLRRSARRGGEVHGQDQRQAGHRLPAVQLLRRSRRRPRHRRHGLHLRRGRGGHRLPERPRREGRPGEGPPVPSLRAPRSCVAAIPATAKKIAVLDRTKEPGALGEPLYQDVVTALANAGRNDIQVIGGRYGLGSKDTPPASVFAVYDELKQGRAEAPVHHRHRGRRDQPVPAEDKNCPNTAAPGTIECKFWGLGGDGTVGANKNSIKIIGDHTDKYVQAYFQYDSKKTGGVTISHLRFGDKPIKCPVLHQQGRLRGLPQPLLHHQGLQDGPATSSPAACS